MFTVEASGHQQMIVIRGFELVGPIGDDNRLNGQDRNARLVATESYEPF
jgi:hypothetical protein